MKSKTSFFNKTLFLNLLRRFWPIFAVYLAVWIIIEPVALGNMLQYAQYSRGYTADPLAQTMGFANTVLSMGLYGGVIMSGIFAGLVAMAAFSYLYSSRSVSMICALPIKREGVFLSVFVSGLSTLLMANLVILLITLAVTAAYGMLAAVGGYVLQCFAMVCLSNIFFFGFASLCASLTGSILVLPLVYAVLNFTAVVVESLVKTVMGMFIYGIRPGSPETFLWLSPPVRLFTTDTVKTVSAQTAQGIYYTSDVYYSGWLTLGLYAVAGLAFAVLAMLLIKRRRMESAGDVVAIRPLKPVFKYCLSVGCALVLGLLIYSIVFSYSEFHGVKAMFYMLLFMLVGAFVGYFAAEMLLQKTFRVFKRATWLRFGVTGLVIAALMLCGEFDLYGIEKKLPAADQVQGVSVNVDGENVLLETPENIAAVIAAHGDIITHKLINEAWEPDGIHSTSYVGLVYTYHNGKTLERSYSIDPQGSNDIYALNDILNTKEAVDYRKRLGLPVTINTISDAFIEYYDIAEMQYRTIELSPRAAVELYQDCILPDIESGALGKVWLVPDEDYRSNVYDCTFRLSLEERQADLSYNSDYFYTTLTAQATRTRAWLDANVEGLELATMGESEALQKRENPYSYPMDKAQAEYAKEYGYSSSSDILYID
jgi:ABC-2 type transport system permease protein